MSKSWVRLLHSFPLINLFLYILCLACICTFVPRAESNIFLCVLVEHRNEVSLKSPFFFFFKFIYFSSGIMWVMKTAQPGSAHAFLMVGFRPIRPSLYQLNWLGFKPKDLANTAEWYSLDWVWSKFLCGNFILFNFLNLIRCLCPHRSCFLLF